LDDIEETMRELKKQFVRLRDCDVGSVKELLVSFGFATIDAEGEADALCAKLSIRKRVDACMSDDTDMFVYGCPVVLRNISLLNHSAMRYDTNAILKTLGLTQQEFKMMCVVSGTDYSHHSASSASSASFVSPDAVFKKLTKFKSLSSKETQKYDESGGGFYDWYSEQTTMTTKRVIDASGTAIGAITYLMNESMFDTNTCSETKGQGQGQGQGYKQLVVLNRDDIHRKRIIEIMMKEDFIFIEASPSDEVILKSLSSGTGSLTTSPVYGINQIPEEKHANVLASEVYGINVSSFQELHKFHKKNKYFKNGK